MDYDNLTEDLQDIPHGIQKALSNLSKTIPEDANMETNVTANLVFINTMQALTITELIDNLEEAFKAINELGGICRMLSDDMDALRKAHEVFAEQSMDADNEEHIEMRGSA